MDTNKRSGTSLMTDGILTLLAGLVLLFLTAISQNAIVVVFSAMVIVLGITQMIAAGGEGKTAGETNYLALLGLYSFAAGVGLLFFMNVSLSTVIMLVAIYIAITGVAEMVAGVAFRKDIRGYSWLVASGAVRTVFALFLIFSTGIALATFILYIALYAVIQGFTMSVLGYEVREGARDYDSPLLQ